MKAKILLLTILTHLIFSHLLHADSPLTSTEINRPYSSMKVVILAGKGSLTEKLMKYLASEKKPIDAKMAVINRIGWDHEGICNAGKFCEYLMDKKGYRSWDDLCENGSGHELLCLAYLKAMDNYSDIEEAASIAEKATERNPESFTFNIITALIKSQKKLLEFDWCEAYNITNRVRENHDLQMDMNYEAVWIIFKYMDQYIEYCGEEN